MQKVSFELSMSSVRLKGMKLLPLTITRLPPEFGP